MTPLRRLCDRVGRRGAFLLFLALVDLAYAHGMAFPTVAARANPTYQFLVEIVPLWAWALVWGVVGALCAVQAFMRRDRFAYTAAAATKVLFGVLLLLAWLSGAVERGYISAAIWLAFAGVTLLIAGWPEGQQS